MEAFIQVEAEWLEGRLQGWLATAHERPEAYPRWQKVERIAVMPRPAHGDLWVEFRLAGDRTRYVRAVAVQAGDDRRTPSKSCLDVLIVEDVDAGALQRAEVHRAQDAPVTFF